MFIWLPFNLNHQLICNAGVNMDIIMIMWACYTCANDLQHENNMQWLSRIVELLQHYQHYQILCIVTLYRCDQFSLCHSIHAPRAQWCHWKEIDDPGFVTEAAASHYYPMSQLHYHPFTIYMRLFIVCNILWLVTEMGSHPLFMEYI